MNFFLPLWFKGIKANLKRLYQLITEEQFNVCQTKDKYKKLLFALCFFHAVLLERKKFQQLGWNVIYSFNDSDFEVIKIYSCCTLLFCIILQVSENLLTMYLDEYANTPWDALKYLIAGVNYGGHVTDDFDRRLLTTYINQYFCDDAINMPYFRFEIFKPNTFLIFILIPLSSIIEVLKLHSSN